MNREQDLAKWTFFTIAAVTAGLVLLIIGFLVYTAAPVLGKTGIGFITNSVWNYDTHEYGIWIFLVNTLLLTLMTMVIAVPFGILTAIYLAEWAPAWLEQILRPLVELLVGIPSVVYGLFGIFVLSQFLGSNIDPMISGTLGTIIPFFRFTDEWPRFGFFLSAVVLSIMILPTIIALSQDAMRAVPREYREASLALGTTRWETIRGVVIPAAFSGILTSVILGMMRAMGETMAVVMLLGNTTTIPKSIFDSGYVMTSKILNDIGFYMIDPEPRAALFSIAVVIFILEILAVAAVRGICLLAREH